MASPVSHRHPMIVGVAIPITRVGMPNSKPVVTRISMPHHDAAIGWSVMDNPTIGWGVVNNAATGSGIVDRLIVSHGRVTVAIRWVAISIAV